MSSDIGPQILGLIDKHKILRSSIDVVRFHWPMGEEDDYGEKVHYTAQVTIWIGVLPDTLSGELAFTAASGILELRKQQGIEDTDVAFWESVCWPSTGPTLLAPASDLDPLRHVIPGSASPLLGRERLGWRV